MYNGTGFLAFNTILQDYTTPLVYREVEVSPKLALLPSKATVPDFLLSSQLEYIGNKTYSFSTLLYDQVTNEVYGRTRNHLAFVKRGTSSAATIPEWWRDKFSNKISNKELTFQPQTPFTDDSDSTHIFETQTSWNDISYNFYLDHQTYLPICLDGMMDAVVKKQAQRVQR